jgi:hypothetical protein
MGRPDGAAADPRAPDSPMNEQVFGCGLHTGAGRQHRPHKTVQGKAVWQSLQHVKHWHAANRTTRSPAAARKLRGKSIMYPGSTGSLPGNC